MPKKRKSDKVKLKKQKPQHLSSNSFLPKDTDVHIHLYHSPIFYYITAAVFLLLTVVIIIYIIILHDDPFNSTQKYALRWLFAIDAAVIAASITGGISVGFKQKSNLVVNASSGFAMWFLVFFLSDIE